jgi:hypothetical protein
MNMGNLYEFLVDSHNLTDRRSFVYHFVEEKGHYMTEEALTVYFTYVDEGPDREAFSTSGSGLWNGFSRRSRTRTPG